jgi:hypothetical protein
VLQDPDNRWIQSRTIWNQHTYHITNVNDDGTIPLVETNNWSTWNNYRQNTPAVLPKEAPGADMTGRSSPSIEPSSDCVKRWTLAANICNRGAAPVKAGVQGTFYLGDPRKAGTKICSGKTTRDIKPGECTKVTCAQLNPTKDAAIDLWFRADDDGAGSRTVEECKEKNNLLHTPNARCKHVG